MTSPCDNHKNIFFKYYYFWVHDISGQHACQCCLFYRGVIVYAIVRELFHYLPINYAVALLVVALTIPLWFNDLNKLK
jgi:hypothetical protein